MILIYVTYFTFFTNIKLIVFIMLTLLARMSGEKAHYTCLIIVCIYIFLLYLSTVHA